MLTWFLISLGLTFADEVHFLRIERAVELQYKPTGRRDWTAQSRKVDRLIAEARDLALAGEVMDVTQLYSHGRLTTPFERRPNAPSYKLNTEVYYLLPRAVPTASRLSSLEIDLLGDRGEVIGQVIFSPTRMKFAKAARGEARLTLDAEVIRRIRAEGAKAARVQLHGERGRSASFDLTPRQFTAFLNRTSTSRLTRGLQKCREWLEVR